jgi:hypothetical protein
MTDVNHFTGAMMRDMIPEERYMKEERAKLATAAAETLDVPKHSVLVTKGRLLAAYLKEI